MMAAAKVLQEQFVIAKKSSAVLGVCFSQSVLPLFFTNFGTVQILLFYQAFLCLPILIIPFYSSRSGAFLIFFPSSFSSSLASSLQSLVKIFSTMLAIYPANTPSALWPSPGTRVQRKRLARIDIFLELADSCPCHHCSRRCQPICQQSVEKGHCWQS